MGTNYYWHESGERTCSHCKQATPNLHIGKSSMGWTFSLHIHPDEGIYNLDHWRAKWASGLIVDEYGDTVTPEAMLACITERGGGKHPLTSHVGYRDRHGFAGPKATYGGPTYDLCDYEFS